MNPASLLDIGLVSITLFLLLSWLRRSLPRHAARRSLLAAPLGGAVYLLAREVDLALLEQVLEVLFVAALVAMVVVYQADIRRLLEQAFSGRAGPQPTAGIIEGVVEAVTALAERRIGALIAFKGREPWTPHQQGGVELGAAVSVPLICSVFDPHTPGHDGALLIEGDRASRFAVHLPLSTDLPGVSRFGGTRHAAALGLAQQCDALVVVVSEETGSISVAEDGLLTILPDAGALRGRLLAFRRATVGGAATGPRRRGLTPSMQTGFASVVLTVVLWFALVYSPDTILRSYDLPLAIRNLPGDWTITEPLPTTVRVDLVGSEQRLRELGPDGLTLALDLSEPTSGRRTVTLGAGNLSLPPGVTLRRVQPDALSFELRRTHVVEVPIVVPTIGTLPDGLILVSIRPTPPTVPVVVVEGDAPPVRVLTQVLDLRTVEADGAVTTTLTPPAGVAIDGAGSVEVEVDVRQAAPAAPGVV